MEKALFAMTLANFIMFATAIGMEFGHSTGNANVEIEELTTNTQSWTVTTLTPLEDEAPVFYTQASHPRRMCELQDW